MLQKISTTWPTIRQVIYSVAAAIFGGLTLLGVFTDADVTTYLGHTATVLTGIGTLVYILAGLYTPNPRGAQPTTIGDGTDINVEHRISRFDVSAHHGTVELGPNRATLSVTRLPEGSDPGATLTGDPNAPTLNMGIPRVAVPTVGELREELERRLSGR